MYSHPRIPANKYLLFLLLWQYINTMRDSSVIQRLCFLCLMMTIFVPCLVMGEGPSIGKARTGKGDVVVVRVGQTIPLKVGDRLYQKDMIRTGIDSAVGIVFEDNTVLSLGPNSELVIDEYIFAPEKGVLSMVARILKGTASYLSGIIGRQSPESVKFHTPDATIGIRGTQFLVKAEGG